MKATPVTIVAGVLLAAIIPENLNNYETTRFIVKI